MTIADDGQWQLSLITFLLQDKGDYIEGAPVEDEDDYFAKQWKAICQEYLCYPYFCQGDD